MNASQALGLTKREALMGLGAVTAGSFLSPHKARAGTPATVSGPIQGGRHGWPFAGFVGDLESIGYLEEEYFIEGRATRYAPVGPMSDDGKWTVVPAGEAPFKTRFFIRRPKDPAKFNGTVIVEWLNVTNGYELATMGLRPEGLYSDGFAFVGLSCQVVGHEGFRRSPQGLKVWDPERYGSLSIAGDSYSFDILSQAGTAVGPRRSRQGVDPLGGLEVRKVIATGASQSAARLRTYMNAIHPRDRVFDAFVPLIDFSRATGFDDAVLDSSAPSAGPSSAPIRQATRVRDDLSVPVMVVNSETETLAYMRQPDTDRYRFWEIAGASHAPATATVLLRAVWRKDQLPAPTGPVVGSDVNWRSTADAAMVHMHHWINGGPPPPTQPLIELTPGSQSDVVRDEFGHARGGVRLPEVEVPIAHFTVPGGWPPPDLRGTTMPLPMETLRRIYPSNEVYVELVAQAAQRAVARGVIPSWRAVEYVQMAEAVRF